MDKVGNGRKHRGFMALSLLLGLAALLTVAAAALAMMVRGFGGAVVYQNGLAAAYGAESGANWGLAYVKQEGARSRRVAFDQPDAHVEVRVTIDGAGATIQSTAQEAAGANRRFLTLECTRETGSDGMVVTVEKVSADAF